MRNISEVLHVKVAKNQLYAELHLSEEAGLAEMSYTEQDILQWLLKQRIAFGVKESVVKQLVASPQEVDFPIQIAEGKAPIHGEDGYVKYVFEINTNVDRSEGYDFREVMRIPIIEKDDKLASLIPPTKGENGITVFGTALLARPGKPARMRAGKNVAFNEVDKTFYATEKGQVSFGESAINVFTVYEVNESISMKTGNIDFVGSVIIRGDVPTGFTVKASGDISVFGMVEAATLISGKSIFISEGISGMKIGSLQAGEDVNIGYINQAKVTAGSNINVENSILHSECGAVQDIICQRGSIIGGSIIAGRSVSVRELGNKVNTKTDLSFGVNELLLVEKEKLEKEIGHVRSNIEKTKLLITRMEAKPSLDSTERINLLKIRNSHVQAKETLAELTDNLKNVNAIVNNKDRLKLSVRGILHPNVTIAFGRYKRVTDQEYNHVSVTIEKNEINISPL